MSVPALLDALAPVLAHLKGVDLADPQAAEALNAALPIDGAILAPVEALVRQGLDAGWLCPRQGPGLRYGRLTKASSSEQSFSIETVDMDCAGPGHTHPQGELDLCFAIDGQPTFDGNPPGWTVYPAGSWHVPTVAGGRMGILYFLPGGAIRFEPEPV